MRDNTVQDAVRDGIKLLGLRAHSRAEIITKLEKKGFDGDTVEAAIGKLESLGLIDDRTFASACMESMARRRPEGRMMARVRLMRKGVSEEVVDETLRDYDARGLCLAAAEKKMRSLSGTHETKRKKLITFLKNRGFDWPTIQDTVEQLLGGQQDQLADW